MRNQEPRTDKSDWSVQTSYALSIGRPCIEAQLETCATADELFPRRKIIW